MVAQIDREYIRSTGFRTLVRLLSYGAFEGRAATTRGQFINPLVWQHLRAGARFAPTRPVDRPIFLIGMGRSGTTWLGTVLSTHPSIGFINEPKLMWRYILPNEDVGGFFSATSEGFYVAPSRADAEIRQQAASLFGYYLWITRSARLLDKYPELTYRTQFLKALFPDAQIVAIVRRPDQVVQSVVAWNERFATGRQSWWGIDDAKWNLMKRELLPQDPIACALYPHHGANSLPPADRALVEWCVASRAIIEANSRGEIDALIHYEDLARSPGAVIEQLVSDLELAPSARVLAFAERTAVSSPVVRSDLTEPVARAGTALEPRCRLLGYA